MTAADTLDREGTLYITDAELIRRMGVPEKIARQTIRALDANPRSGFPKKQKIWGDRRYWPAVRSYLDRTAGATISAPTTPRGSPYGRPPKV